MWLFRARRSNTLVARRTFGAVSGLGLFAVLGVLALVAHPVQAIEVGQRDDFQDDTTQGWGSGGANPNPPVQVPDGGPLGAGDGFLRVEGNGTTGSGGNLIAFNTAQWTGDYLAAGVVAIRLALSNLGPSDLVVRLLLEGPGGGFVTEASSFLPAGSGWRSAVFPLDPASSGGGDPELVLSGVTKLRVLHAPTSAGAESVDGVLGMDDVTAISGDACRDAGLPAPDQALCHVYCDVLECAQSSRPVCEQITRVFEYRTGSLPPCEFDRDGDGLEDGMDNCPDVPNPDQADADGDGWGDACDNCPDDVNPGQEDTFGEAGVGDVCDCPCFSTSEVSDLVETLAQPTVYEDLICVDTRVSAKPLTFVSAFRVDGAPCATETPECSALATEFTEDSVCQLNAPAPAPGVSVQGITDRQREVCRERIVSAAQEEGLSCN